MTTRADLIVELRDALVDLRRELGPIEEGYIPTSLLDDVLEGDIGARMSNVLELANMIQEADTRTDQLGKVFERFNQLRAQPRNIKKGDPGAISDDGRGPRSR